MTLKTADDAREPDALPTGRWFLAGTLLVVEYVLALYVFDSERLPIGQQAVAFGVIGKASAWLLAPSPCSQVPLPQCSGGR